MQSKEDLSTLKLRNTLYELKQFTGRDHNRSHAEAPPIGITLISIQSYKNKRKLDKHVMQRTNRENIENELKLEIFKKIRETMGTSHRHSGLEVVRATMHFNHKSKPDSRARSKRLLEERNERIEETSGRKAKTFRFRTECAGYRPNESCPQYYQPQKKAISERKFNPHRSEDNKEEIRGWNIDSEEEEYHL